jgi:hypothetical protein
MVAAKAEGRCRRRYSRGGAPEFVGDDGETAVAIAWMKEE